MGDGGDDTNSGAGVGLLARQNGVARSHFGKFDSQAEAEKWIAEHHWLTEQSKGAPDAPEATPN
jgi:hypothetical protein